MSLSEKFKFDPCLDPIFIDSFSAWLDSCQDSCQDSLPEPKPDKFDRREVDEEQRSLPNIDDP